MGTQADAIFAPGAMNLILDATDVEGVTNGGLTGSIEADQNGTYYRVTGEGAVDVGMFFTSEGTAVTDRILDAFRTRCGEGILMIVDPEIGELSISYVDSTVCRPARCLMSE